MESGGRLITNVLKLGSVLTVPSSKYTLEFGRAPAMVIAEFCPGRQ
jgi:hypothetical protein